MKAYEKFRFDEIPAPVNHHLRMKYWKERPVSRNSVLSRKNNEAKVFYNYGIGGFGRMKSTIHWYVLETDKGYLKRDFRHTHTDSHIHCMMLKNSH